MKGAKRTIALFGFLIMIIIIAVTPVAAVAPADTKIPSQGGMRYQKPYLFDFIPPYSGSLQTTSQAIEIEAVGAGKVKQDFFWNEIATVGVNYYLFKSTSSVTDIATTVVKVYNDYNLHYLTYKTGYGALGEDYKLAGYPGKITFNYFHVEGMWDSSVNNP